MELSHLELKQSTMTSLLLLTGTRERLQAQGGGTMGSQGRHTPLPPLEPYPKEGGGGEGEKDHRRTNEGTMERQQGDGSTESDSKENLR